MLFVFGYTHYTLHNTQSNIHHITIFSISIELDCMCISGPIEQIGDIEYVTVCG